MEEWIRSGRPLYVPWMFDLIKVEASSFAEAVVLDRHGLGRQERERADDGCEQGSKSVLSHFLVPMVSLQTILSLNHHWLDRKPLRPPQVVKAGVAVVV